MKKAIFTVDDRPQANNAGPKAKVDFDYFMKSQGFEIIHRHLDVDSKIKKLTCALFTVPNLFRGEQYDELIFQYPTYSSFLMKRMLPKMKQHAKKLYFILHDVESLRLFTDDADYWDSEKALFNSTDGLIVHDQALNNWLREHGVTVPMVNLEIFDYHNPQPVQINEDYDRSICFAGNLAKSSFLNHLSLNQAKLDIYGPHPSESYNSGVTYKEIYSPEELPKHLTDNFGLVWDGSSTETCDGKFGNYLRYNAPHKTSLYLSTGIPVIIWKQAALADFIVDHQVGIAVDSLQELDQVLSQLSKEQYRELKQNAVRLAQQLRSGYYSHRAVNAIEQY